MRRLLLTTAAIIGLASLVATPASAERAPQWATVGNWWIGVDKTVGNGCFMTTSYRDGTALRVGFVNMLDNKPFDGMAIIVGNPAWRSLELGKMYDIQWQLDNAPVQTFKARAIMQGGAVMLHMGFQNPRLVIANVAVGSSLRLSYAGNLLTVLPLTGSSAAAKETLNCNQQFAGAGAGDPFAAPRPVVNDPFARSF